MVLTTTFSLSLFPSGVDSSGMFGISNKIVLIDSKMRFSDSFLIFKFSFIESIFFFKPSVFSPDDFNLPKSFDKFFLSD
jgi:hypothetical protein